MILKHGNVLWLVWAFFGLGSIFFSRLMTDSDDGSNSSLKFLFKKKYYRTRFLIIGIFFLGYGLLKFFLD